MLVALLRASWRDLSACRCAARLRPGRRRLRRRAPIARAQLCSFDARLSSRRSLPLSLARCGTMSGVTDWSTYISSGLSGLVGAAVGAGVSWLATMRLIRAQREADSWRHETEERAKRDELARALAADLYERAQEIAAILVNLPSFARGLEGRSAKAQYAERAAVVRRGINDFSRQLAARGYLLPQECRDRCWQLARLSTQAAHSEFKDGAAQRVGADVFAYNRYVRLTLQSFIMSESPPDAVEPPVLLRSGFEAWSPNPTPENWDENP